MRLSQVQEKMIPSRDTENRRWIYKIDAGVTLHTV